MLKKLSIFWKVSEKSNFRKISQKSKSWKILKQIEILENREKVTINIEKLNLEEPVIIIIQ